MSGPVIYLVRSWPRLTQTFILNEVLALERRGVDLLIFSLARSHELVVQPQVRDVRAPVRFLTGATFGHRVRQHATVLAAEPLRYLRALSFSLRHRELCAGYATASTVGCFDYAVQVAAEVVRLRRNGQAPVHLHAHFAHDPALVALLVFRLTRLPYSFTGHARDLVQIPLGSLLTRSAEATAIVTCCEANATYLADALPAGNRVPMRVIHHGVELERFNPSPRLAASETVRLLAIGRLVEKKGFASLLLALSRVKTQGHSFTCGMYGDGPLREELIAVRDKLDLAMEVEMLGERQRDELLRALKEADVFVLTPLVTADGDRDGIPNVLVEAMACGLPVVTTSVGGIEELVRDGVNGFVSAPDDIAGIAQHLAALITRPRLRARVGAAARRSVEAEYDVDAAARQLEEVFRLPTVVEERAS